MLHDPDEAGDANTSVSVNLSTARLNDPKLVQRQVEVAESEGVSVQHIRIEILENTLLTDRNAMLSKNIFRLAEVGFPIELDDFGSGHAAIASLRTYPIWRIKTDRSLIPNVAADKQLQAITTSIFDLCEELQIEVLAEGVEFSEDYEYLLGTSCGFAQGFFISHPILQESLLGWVTGEDAPRSRDSLGEAVWRFPGPGHHRVNRRATGKKVAMPDQRSRRYGNDKPAPNGAGFDVSGLARERLS